MKLFKYIDIDNLKKNFDYIDDWEEKYAYIIELGNELPFYPSELKVDDNKITGCVSQVWLDYQIKEGRVYLRGDSDAMIVKGLIYLILSFYNGKDKNDYEKSNYEDFLLEFGLNDHISPQRANGIKAMINKLEHVFETI